MPASCFDRLEPPDAEGFDDFGNILNRPNPSEALRTCGSATSANHPVRFRMSA